MGDNTSNDEAPQRDLEGAGGYVPIPGGPHPTERPRLSKKILFSSFAAASLLAALLTIVSLWSSRGEVAKVNDVTGINPTPGEFIMAPSRGVAQGVSEKVHRRVGGGELSFSWSNAMLTWQRTAFHFQPPKNWMNDPNAPLFHMGWYHLFYQYNQESAVWGNITWGHAVSKDLIHWLHLPYAMVPDQWYDVNGVWTGSATTLPDGKIVILYTGDTTEVVQVQCLAYPSNQSDPLLLEWTKDTSNPVLVPPPGINRKDFRDPTTAWLGPDGDRWRITIGSKVNKTGIALVYETGDFVNYELLDGYLHEVPGTGMWECIDFYPVSLTEVNGLDTSVNGPGIKHVMKASLDDDKNDYYALGTYDPIGNRWTPDDPDLDVGIGLRYDYGKFYASKTFYDQNKKRRVLWGWITETDAESLDLLKGWSGVQAIPRTITLDHKTGSNILQWPVEEVESLRSEDSVEVEANLGPGSVVPIELDYASQLDIFASFAVENKEEALDAAPSEPDNIFDCAKSVGAVNRGVLGPFGILVLADEKLTESTPIYFYITKGADGKPETHFCADELRSSRAFDVDKIVYGSRVPVLEGENLTIRSLVDHSIVESFAQGGRTVITSRVYPTRAIGTAARVFLFNNATAATVKASIKIWKMGSADIKQFPLDQI